MTRQRVHCITDLVLFDIDGTLISAKGAGSQALARAIFSCYGVEAPMQQILLDGKTDPMIVHEALALAGETHQFQGTLTNDFLGAYGHHLGEALDQCQHYQVLPGVSSLLARLGQNATFLVGLATGNVAAGARRKLEKGKLLHYFHFGGYGCDSESRTEIVLQAVKRGRKILGDRFSGKSIVVGDTPSDIKHGRKAGARTVAVATGIFNFEQLRACGPNAIFHSLQKTDEVLQVLQRI